jgi:hypothetical protein
MEKSSQIAWKIVPLRHFFPLKIVPLIEVLLYCFLISSWEDPLVNPRRTPAVDGPGSSPQHPGLTLLIVWKDRTVIDQRPSEAQGLEGMFLLVSEVQRLLLLDELPCV